MTQKIVTFKVAKALKETGYPQVGRYQYTYSGKLVDLVREGGACYGPMAPTYLDAWLWLWRKKDIRIYLQDAKNPKEPEIERGCYVGTNQLGGICTPEVSDPENAIVDIIDFLVENNLIK